MIQNKFDKSGRIKDGVNDKPFSSRIDTFANNTVSAFRASILFKTSITTLNSELDKQKNTSIEKSGFKLGVF